ncbi:MAG: glycoside hydrolase family 16 protein [Tabrizicola sp.]
MRLIGLFVLLSTPALAGPPEGYRLVWADEFNAQGLPDADKWAYDTEANATGWYNNELQYYAVGRAETTALGNGVLSITARQERLTEAPDYGGQDYSSGRLITRGLFEFTYGYVEVRAKLPCGQGLWPAIWMLGATGDWPASGEIDIMEHLNAEPRVYGTLHMAATAGTGGLSQPHPLANACEAFHLYQLTWTRDRIEIAVDGQTYNAYNNPGQGAETWPYDRPFYLLLNLAVGGDWPGDPDPSVLPATFEIDYVRVYQP